ncbi:MAG: hypothetical protein QM681_24690 [Novosphingobium sp.]
MRPQAGPVLARGQRRRERHHPLGCPARADTHRQYRARGRAMLVQALRTTLVLLFFAMTTHGVFSAVATGRCGRLIGGTLTHFCSMGTGRRTVSTNATRQGEWATSRGETRP